MFQLLILSGARRDEIAALRWSEIKDDTIILGRERTKAGEGHSIPLAPAVLDIIRGLPRIGDSDFVFTTNGRTPVSGFSKIKKRLDSLTKIPPWRTHDLRRVVATGLQRIGINLQVIEAVFLPCRWITVGHCRCLSTPQFRCREAHRPRWAREVERIIGGKPAKVLPLRRPK